MKPRDATPTGVQVNQARKHHASGVEPRALTGGEAGWQVQSLVSGHTNSVSQESGSVERPTVGGCRRLAWSSPPLRRGVDANRRPVTYIASHRLGHVLIAGTPHRHIVCVTIVGLY